MLQNELKKRDLPQLRSREEMVEIMQREVYGYLPEVEYSITTTEPITVEQRYSCGEVHHSYIVLTVHIGNKSHAFRVDRFLHTDEKKRPMVLLNNIHPATESPYFSREELTEYNVDYLVFCYTDITSDDGDFTTGLTPLLLPGGQVSDSTCGKIGIWAWGAMRVLDYALTLPGTDPENIAVAGHSRLGKTALYTAMMDTRFKFAFSNAAGCAGDSLAHGSSGFINKEIPRSLGKRGENIADIVENFSYWFCKNYGKYTKTLISDEFDQHFLIAAIAPRFVAVGSCDLDFWADPESQQLCCLAASEQWEKQGLDGLTKSDRYLEPGECLSDGRLCYFKIHSKHFLSRHSWKNYIEFLEKHKNESV